MKKTWRQVLCFHDVQKLIVEVHLIYDLPCEFHLALDWLERFQRRPIFGLVGLPAEIFNADGLNFRLFVLCAG